MQNKKSYLSLNKSKRERGGITFLALWMQWEGREAREVWPEMVGKSENNNLSHHSTPARRIKCLVLSYHIR